MKKLLPLLAPALLAGCHHGPDAPAPDSLVGTWQLTALQCQCPPGLPNETVAFAADSTFRYFRDGKLAYSGSFNTGHYPSCAGQPPQPLLTLHGTVTYILYAPSGNYTLSNNTLVVSGGSACVADLPVYTYRRL